MQVALLEAQKYNWNLIPGQEMAGCATSVTTTPKTCASFLRKACSAASPYQRLPLLMGYMNQTAALNSLDNFEQNLASFLLARGDYAWIGTGYIGCGPTGRLPYCGPDGRSPNCTGVPYLRPPALDRDYGEALGLCKEQEPGVFSRKYTHAEVSLDCNRWAANISMTSYDDVAAPTVPSFNLSATITSTPETRWQNTTEGISLCALDQGDPSNGDGPELEQWGHDGFSDSFFVWAPRNQTEWRAKQPLAILGAYVPFGRDPTCTRNITWWQKNHPSWVLYTSDRKTPAYAYGDCNVPLDVANPAFVQWQLHAEENENSADKIAARGYDAVNFDNFWTLQGAQQKYSPAGIWGADGKWVQRYDNQQDTRLVDDQLTWLKMMYKGLQTITSSGSRKPLMTVLNFGVSSDASPGADRVLGLNYTDPAIAVITNNSDGVLSEEGFTVCGSQLVTDAPWLNKVKFAVSYQEAGKAHMECAYWNTSDPASSYKIMANATTVEFVLGSYLMGHSQAASLYATQQFKYRQLAAPVGHPLGSMRPVDSAAAVYGRNYSNARILVNHRGLDGPTVRVPLDGSLQYWGLDGRRVAGSSVVLKPTSAKVLLLKPPQPVQ